MWRCVALILGILAGFREITTVYSSRECDATRLNQLLNGALRVLQFMDTQKTVLNLDGLMGVRITSDQMEVLAENMSQRNFTGKKDLLLRLQYLVNMSNYILEHGVPTLQVDDPTYYGLLKGLFDIGSWKLNYPQRKIDRSLQWKVTSCDHSMFFENTSDICIAELTQRSLSRPDRCNVSATCLNRMTMNGLKDYALTHEVIYLQIAEMHGCVPTLVEMGYNLSHIVNLQNAFCSNVYRDAELLAQKGFPPSHRDLWLEQIGLCGIYGFSDFWKEDWIDQMLDWQTNGCYIHSERWNCQDELQDNSITKRNDKSLEGNCSSHMTTVGLMAIAVNVRFCAEAFAQQMEEQGQTQHEA